jgi:hypothetical protein
VSSSILRCFGKQFSGGRYFRIKYRNPVTGPNTANYLGMYSEEPANRRRASTVILPHHNLPLPVPHPEVFLPFPPSFPNLTPPPLSFCLAPRLCLHSAVRHLRDWYSCSAVFVISHSVGFQPNEAELHLVAAKRPGADCFGNPIHTGKWKLFGMLTCVSHISLQHTCLRTRCYCS